MRIKRIPNKNKRNEKNVRLLLYLLLVLARQRPYCWVYLHGPMLCYDVLLWGKERRQEKEVAVALSWCGGVKRILSYPTSKKLVDPRPSGRPRARYPLRRHPSAPSAVKTATHHGWVMKQADRISFKLHPGGLGCLNWSFGDYIWYKDMDDSAGLLVLWFLFMVEYGSGIQPGHVVLLCCALSSFLVFILMRSACFLGCSCSLQIPFATQYELF